MILDFPWLPDGLDSFVNVLDDFSMIFDLIYSSFSVIWSLFTTPIFDMMSDVMTQYPLTIPSLAPLAAALSPLLLIPGVKEITLLGLMAGIALPIFIVYSLLIWLLNLVT